VFYFLPLLLNPHFFHTVLDSNAAFQSINNGARNNTRPSFGLVFAKTGSTLKKILERKDQYLYVARRTFTNLFLGVAYLHRATSNLKN
jgi:hypothetical protein